MQTSDILVVGGGPAGSTCARRLVDAGANVTVVDAAVFPRDKVCAGWVTPDVIETVRLDVDEYAARRTFQPLHRFTVGTIEKSRTVGTRGDRVVSAAIRRCEFDTYLLQRSGATLACGEPVRSIQRDRGLWIVNGRWSAPMLVGAGGAGCPVARHLNGPVKHTGDLIVAREAEFELSAGDRPLGLEPGVALIYFTEDVAGYGWCVPKGRMLNVGIGRMDRHLPREVVTAFAGFVARTHRVAMPHIDRWRGHAYLAGTPGALSRTADGALLVGDAAGLASDRSGEGIGPAVDSAVMAASVIVSADGDFSRERLARYDALVTERWPQRRPWPVLERLIPPGVTTAIATRLLRSRAFVEHVVVKRWFLHEHIRH
jgi:flavin-dependent dehydrogenase